jgi:hypothetical protein
MMLVATSSLFAEEDQRAPLNPPAAFAVAFFFVTPAHPPGVVLEVLASIH